jgi:predicted AAA+ superfamily ATPase
MELEKASKAPAAHQSTTLEGKKQEDRDSEQEERIRRREQHMIDKIMKGEEKGHYYLILGPKGSGKTSMMIQAVCSPP